MFRLSKPWAVAVLVLASQISALGAEIAVLRNGNTLRHDRREQRGDITRLYIADGYIDIPTDQIVSFEADDTPAPQPETTQPATATTASAMPTPQPAAPTTKPDLDSVVRDASARRQLDPDFVNSVIKAESNFYPRAVSPKGAQGLMQLMPGTAAKLGVRDPFDPKANVEAGTAYLSQLFELYDNDPIRALAAYNAGPQRVQQYHGVPPYRETKLYIARIVRDYNAKKARQKTQTMATQAAGTKTRAASAAHRPAGKKKTGQQQQASLSPIAASGRSKIGNSR